MKNRPIYELFDAAQICAILFLYQAASKLLPFSGYKWLTSPGRVNQKRFSELSEEAKTALIKKTVGKVRRLSRYFPVTPSCLIQTMAARSLLYSKGVETQMTVGVRLDQKRRFHAHAWLAEYPDCESPRFSASRFECNPF
jgi:hypothetical protein